MTPLQNSPNPTIGNEELAEKLSEFDYSKLQGKAWQDYLAFHNGELQNPEVPIESVDNPRSGGLPEQQLYDYEGYRVIAIKRHLYPGMKDSPTYVYGIQLKASEPEVKSTRITAGRARLLNAQVDNMTAVVPGIYYLIKKVEPKQSNAETESPAKRSYNKKSSEQ